MLAVNPKLLNLNPAYTSARNAPSDVVYPLNPTTGRSAGLDPADRRPRFPFMKRMLPLFLLCLLAACAAKEPPFNPSTTLNDAEGNMQKENFEKARKLYQEIQEKSPDKSYDAAIMLRIADTYYGEEKFEEALVEYQNFLNYHPVSRDAVYAQFQIAMCSFNQLTTIDRDPEPTKTAFREFEKLLKKYP